jgi:hypothetical protein
MCVTKSPRRHGLFAHKHVSAEDRQLCDLAGALATGSPMTPGVLQCARDLAAIVLHLKEIRRVQAQTARELANAASADTQFDKWFASFPTSKTLTRLARRKTVDPNFDFSMLGPSPDQLRAWRHRLLEEYRMSDSERGVAEMGVILRDKANKMRRLVEYERKALSRRAKAIRLLDHARIEALRCHPK